VAKLGFSSGGMLRSWQGQFWGTLKIELVYRQHYTTRAEAKTTIFAYIEGFYNRQRRHSSLGYLTPEQFEQQFQA
jgi:putative transposase